MERNEGWAGDANVLFPNALQTIAGLPKGYADEAAGPRDLLIPKSPVWDVAPDPGRVPGCSICLVKFLDGSPVVVRYRNVDIHIGQKYAEYIHYLYSRVR
jgi:hypothetical protein